MAQVFDECRMTLATCFKGLARLLAYELLDKLCNHVGNLLLILEGWHGPLYGMDLCMKPKIGPR